MTLKHSKVSAIADDPAADIKPSDWNAGHVIDTDGVDFESRTDLPATPASGDLRVFSKTVAGGDMLSVREDNGSDWEMQPFLGRKKIGMWSAIGNTNSGGLSVFGLTAPSTLGTATTRNVASTNMLTSTRRLGYVSGASANARVAIYNPYAQFWRGNAAGLGGFRLVMRWGCSDAATVTGARTFVGLTSDSSVTTENIGGFLNLFGVVTDSTDSSFCLVHNDGSGAAVKTALGANFPDHTLSADLYELTLYAPPNGSYVGYQLVRLNTGHTASGKVTTDIPANSVFMIPMLSRQNGGSSLAVGLDIVSLYVETSV